MKKSILLISLLIFLFFQCDGQKTLHTNDIALALAKLEDEGKISQSDKKDAFFRFLDDIFNDFNSRGYGHRIKELTNTWNLYEDQDYLTMTGSVAKTDNEVYIFTIVFKDRKNGKFDTVYEQIGNEKSRKYPEDIIPF